MANSSGAGMMRLLVVSTMILSSAVMLSAQQPRASTTLWEPIPLALRDNVSTPPTLKREMIPNIRIGQLNIRFDETPFRAVEQRFALIRGKRGDAGEFVQWVCLSGSDSTGDWILWFQGAEVNGESIGGFTLH